MSDLNIITDAIIAAAEAEAKKISEKAEKDCAEIIKAAEEKANIEAEKYLKESAEKVKNITEIAESGAIKLLATDLLRQKSEMISSLLTECKQEIYKMDDKSYNELLVRLLKKHAHKNDSGIISFNKKDKERLSDEMTEEIEKAGLKIDEGFCDILGGFILKYDKIDENCSVEEIFRGQTEKATDFLNKELFG